MVIYIEKRGNAKYSVETRCYKDRAEADAAEMAYAMDGKVPDSTVRLSTAQASAARNAKARKDKHGYNVAVMNRALEKALSGIR